MPTVYNAMIPFNQQGFLGVHRHLMYEPSPVSLDSKARQLSPSTLRRVLRISVSIPHQEATMAHISL